jgi:hypothetical protein
MKAILITGSRDLQDSRPVTTALVDAQPHLVIEGGATGADRHARNWAKAAGVGLLDWPDDHWGGHVAGPVRNGYMVDVAAALMAAGWEVAVYAFPEEHSRGTWSCVQQAENAGLPVSIIALTPTGAS